MKSLFNKGIYKSTIRRFWWGSAFYLVILFLLTGMMILMNENAKRAIYDTIPYILKNSMLLPGIVIGIAASTIAAMLVYRFVHSRKQSIFTHSLPVNRSANYISTVLGGLTLLAMPIILNSIILMVISMAGYGELFDVASCFVWLGANLLCVFVMFSYATLATMLTGNSFAVAALNILLHTFVILIAAGFGSVASGFLYGYANTNEVLSFVCENNPVVWIVSVADALGSTYRAVDISKVVWNVVIAVALYVVAFVLYRKRRMETAEEVAAFKVLNPVYKYFLTFLGALGAFSFFMSLGVDKTVTLITAVIIVTAVAYFGSEMALKKTLKVWRSYKGYLGFGAVFAIMLAVFAFTSFFGFESRVPDAEDIESVAVFNYYYGEDEPFVENEEIKNYALELHKEILAGEDAKDRWFAGAGMPTRINIKYKLKNGATIYRRYGIDNNKVLEIMNILYAYEDYKLANEEIFKEEIDDFETITTINNRAEGFGNKNKSRELLECIRKDVLALDYNQMYMPGIETWGEIIDIEYQEKMSMTARKYINANYKNTLQWLKDNGYWDMIDINQPAGPLYICKYNSKGDVIEKPYQVVAEAPPYVELYKIADGEDINATIDFIYNYEIRNLPDKEYYSICESDKEGYYSTITDIDEDTLQVLLSQINAEPIAQ